MRYLFTTSRVFGARRVRGFPTCNVTSSNASTILLVRAGSHAYGTNMPTSDLDVRGIMIPPSDYYLGMKRVEQYQEAGG